MRDVDFSKLSPDEVDRLLFYRARGASDEQIKRILGAETAKELAEATAFTPSTGQPVVVVQRVCSEGKSPARLMWEASRAKGITDAMKAASRRNGRKGGRPQKPSCKSYSYPRGTKPPKNARYALEHGMMVRFYQTLKGARFGAQRLAKPSVWLRIVDISTGQQIDRPDMSRKRRPLEPKDVYERRIAALDARDKRNAAKKKPGEGKA